MDIFGRKTRLLKQRISHMELQLKSAFSKVKKDMLDINAWLQYYYQRAQYLENHLNHLYNSTLKLSTDIDGNNVNLAQTSAKLQTVQDSMVKANIELSAIKSVSKKNISREELNFHIENISDKVIQIDKKIEQFSYIPARIESIKEELQEHLSKQQSSVDIDKRIDELQAKLNSIIVKKSPKEKLVEKVTKNSHDYIKAMVISYIKKYEKISGYQLKEMLVEEQNITSKSTLYRILEEIESTDDISIIKQGKEKIFLSKLKKPA